MRGVLIAPQLEPFALSTARLYVWVVDRSVSCVANRWEYLQRANLADPLLVSQASGPSLAVDHNDENYTKMPNELVWLS